MKRLIKWIAESALMTVASYCLFHFLGMMRNKKELDTHREINKLKKKHPEMDFTVSEPKIEFTIKPPPED